MAPLLEETLRFPAVVPAVREADGVRRQYRCPRCRSAEVPDREGIWLCDACLAAAAAAVRAPGPLEGLVVLRTYTPEKWCPHADAETVMVAAEEYDDGLGPCYCAECLAAEQRRRAGRRATAAASATEQPAGADGRFRGSRMRARLSGSVRWIRMPPGISGTFASARCSGRSLPAWACCSAPR